MAKCEDMQGALAASLYEPIDAAERQTLDQHLAGCIACREEYAQLQAFRAAIPVDAPEFQGNLLPAVREAIRQLPATFWFSVPRFLMAVTMMFLLVCVGLILSTKSEPSQNLVQTDPTIAQVQQLLAEDNPAQALVLLKTARDQSESPDEAGQFQLLIANLEYDFFRRYEASYDEYRRLREEYSSVWVRSDALLKDRFDLLTEARESNFEALRQMDIARNQGEAGMPALEQLMARYPGRMVARQALNTMVALVQGEGVAALEQVKSRCTNPVAVAQLDVHLGERYWADRVNPELGRQLLQGVAGSPYEVPARMARDVLARLETGSRE